MADEYIELGKPYTPDKMKWPAAIQQKYDGVPIRFFRTPNGVVPYTRQREIVQSVDHLCEYALKVIPAIGGSITAELIADGCNFKDVSGLVRRHSPSPELRGMVFDADAYRRPNSPYLDRLVEARRLIMNKSVNRCMEVVATAIVKSKEEAEERYNAFMAMFPDAEGCVLHSLAKTYEPGRRLWTFQKMKPQPTMDVEIIGFEEAVVGTSKAPKGMVGRLVSKNHGGIGPGALTHKERKALWQVWCSGKWKPRIAEVKYMKDDTYTKGLRQNTFVQWRDDKETENVD